MARFKELVPSRVGGVKGFNATSEMRIVRVIAEESDLEGGRGSLGNYIRYPDPRDLVEAQWVRLGSGHPWDRDGLKAGRYHIFEHRGQGCWVVGVEYLRNDITIGYPPINTWLIRYRGATITEQILTELEPEPGEEGLTDLWHRPSEEVGSPAFKEVDNIGAATHHAWSVDKESGASVQVWLAMVDSLTEEPRGMVVEDPAWLVTFERTIPNFNEISLPVSIAGFMKAVNRDTFRGAGPLQVKCLDIVLDPLGAEVPGQRIDGVAYRVVVSFLWSFVPFGPHRIVPSFYDSDGHRATVFTGTSGNQVDVKEFRNVRRADFNTLLNILERGS